MADLKISQLTGASTPLAGTEVLPIVQSGSTVKVSVANLTAGRAVGASTVQASTGFGVGVTPTIPLQIQQNGTATGLGFSTNAKLLDSSANKGFQIGYSDSAQKAIFLSNTTGASSSFGFWTYDSGGLGWIEAVEVASNGNTKLSNGNLIQGTAGKGINFTANTPAAGMTSQLLNWYEEGTFTAGFTCGSGSITLKSSFNTCAYTRIGRQVTVTGYLEVDSVSSPSGTLLLTGLPFTIKNANSAYPTGSPFLNLTGAITGTPVMLGYAGTTTVSFRRMSGGSAVDDMANLFGAGSQIIFTFVYIV